MKVSLEPLKTTGKLSAPTDNAFMSGETIDLSRTGIGFIVSSIRIREHYLVGQDRVLNVEVELPVGKIKMKVVGRRYERVGIHLSTERFMIGSEIVEMDQAFREAYEHFLRHGHRSKKGALEFGID